MLAFVIRKAETSAVLAFFVGEGLQCRRWRALSKRPLTSRIRSSDEGERSLHASGPQFYPDARHHHPLLPALSYLIRAPALFAYASPLSRTNIDTALHLAAAAGAHSSVLVLIGAGASPSATNSCGLSPGSCFLRPLGSMVPRAGAAADFSEMRQALREHRERLGHVRRLADANAKRLVVAAVAERATASVHRFVEFALKVRLFGVFFDRTGVCCPVGGVCMYVSCPLVDVRVKTSR